MKAIKKRTVEDIIKGEKIHLEDIVIGGKKYSLDIQNSTCVEGKESLSFTFNKEEYVINIRDGGVYFERLVYRNHDHNDSEILQIKVDDTPGSEKGEILWSSDFPYKGLGYEHYKIPFGSTKVDY